MCARDKLITLANKLEQNSLQTKTFNNHLKSEGEKHKILAGKIKTSPFNISKNVDLYLLVHVGVTGTTLRLDLPVRAEGCHVHSPVWLHCTSIYDAPPGNT